VQLKLSLEFILCVARRHSIELDAWLGWVQKGKKHRQYRYDSAVLSLQKESFGAHFNKLGFILLLLGCPFKFSTFFCEQSGCTKI
jgi:hypothetical protein